MKTILISLLCFCYWGLVGAQIVNLPDANFKDKLLNHNPVIDTNGDNEIQVSEAENFTGIMDVSGSSSNPGGIIDLTGLEAFTDIIGFTANFNDIQSVDFSSNLLLDNITINENPLTNIDVSQNQNLRNLSLSSSNLTSLDVSNKPNLILVQANFAQISSLDVSNCTSLQFLYVQNNNLTNLDLTDLTSLIFLIVSDNPLESIGLENSVSLAAISARNTNISEIDLSANSDLFQVVLNGSDQLTYINLKNGDNDGLIIDGSNMSSGFENLPLLEEVCVDDVNNNLAAFIQSQTTQTVNFSETCRLSTTDLETNLDVVVFPNPATDFLHLESNEPIQSIAIYDIHGRLITTHQNEDSYSKIEIKNLPSGVYFLKLTTQTNRLEYIQFIKE